MAALRAGRVPKMWGAPANLGAFARTLRVAASVPLWQAALHEEGGQGVAALDELLLAWELSADDWVLPYAGSSALGALGPPPELILQAWARIALTAPSISAAEAARALGRLDEILSAMPSQATLYALSTTPDRQNGRRLNLEESPPWKLARAQFKDAFEENTGEAGESIRRIFVGESRGPGALGSRVGANRGMSVPVATFLAGCQQSLARREDFELLWEAYRTRVVASLAHGDFAATDRLDAELRQPGTAANQLEWIDRPSVWESLGRFPLPREQMRPWRLVRRHLVCARLILALRAHRDQRNAWPETLAALSPDRLSAVPPDPLTGQPLRYERREDSFRLLTPGRAGGVQKDEVLYDSTTPAAKQASWRSTHGTSYRPDGEP